MACYLDHIALDMANTIQRYTEHLPSSRHCAMLWDTELTQKSLGGGYEISE